MGHPLDPKISATLAEEGPATGPELAERLDAHPATVLQRCRTLQRTGHVRQVTGGMYALVPEDAVTPQRASD